MRVDLPAFGRPDERHVREELELEREVALVAFRAGIRAPRRPVRGGREPRVSPPAFAARGHEERLPLLDEVADDLPGLTVLHDRSDGHRDRKSRAVLPVAVVPLAVAAAARGEAPREAEGVERVQAAVGDERHAPAVPAVPAGGPAPGHELLAPEGDAAIATVAPGDVDDGFVDEHA